MQQETKQRQNEATAKEVSTVKINYKVDVGICHVQRMEATRMPE